MRKKTVIKTVVCLLLMTIMCIGFASCGCSDKQKDEAAKETTTTATQKTTEAKVYTYDDFVGSWVSNTKTADEVYGGYEITFNKDMTFDAVVTGEEESDSCTFEDGCVSLGGGVLTQKFTFNEDGQLITTGDGATVVFERNK